MNIVGKIARAALLAIKMLITGILYAIIIAGMLVAGTGAFFVISAQICRDALNGEKE